VFFFDCAALGRDLTGKRRQGGLRLPQVPAIREIRLKRRSCPADGGEQVVIRAARWREFSIPGVF